WSRSSTWAWWEGCDRRSARSTPCSPSDPGRPRATRAVSARWAAVARAGRFMSGRVATLPGMAGDPEELIVTDAAAWRAWLERHHAGASGAWLVLARKGAAAPTSLCRDEALEEALCFGWIDGQARGRDDAS